MARDLGTTTEDPGRYRLAGGEDQPELLVALEHAPLVESVLRRAGAAPERVEHSDQLLLTRMQFNAGLGRRLATELPRLTAEDNVGGSTAREDADALAQEIGPGPDTGADALLSHLRAWFRRRYAGWEPTMGKNRLVAHVNVAGGTVSHGGGPDPSPSAPPPPRAGRAGEGVVVGILDTGLVAHPAFAGRRLAAADLLERRESYPYAAGHATFVAGLVLERAPGATLRASECLGPDGQSTSWQVAKDIVRLGRQGVDIINLSLVCYTADRRPPLALATAIDRLDPRVLVVACAGNHGDDALDISDEAHRQPSWPAALDDVVAVGSARRSPLQDGPGHELDPFTPPDAPWIDILTQGNDVTSTYFFGATPEGEVFDGGARWGGTSFSAARLTGRVAAEASALGVPPRQAYQSLIAPLRPARVADGVWLPRFLDTDL